MHICENQILLLEIYTENKCSMNYAQRCREKQKLQLQINKMVLPILLWNKCGYRTLEITYQEPEFCRTQFEYPCNRPSVP